MVPTTQLPIYSPAQSHKTALYTTLTTSTTQHISRHWQSPLCSTSQTAYVQASFPFLQPPPFQAHHSLDPTPTGTYNISNQSLAISWSTAAIMQPQPFLSFVRTFTGLFSTEHSETLTSTQSSTCPLRKPPSSFSSLPTNLGCANTTGAVLPRTNVLQHTFSSSKETVPCSTTYHQLPTVYF